MLICDYCDNLNECMFYIESFSIFQNGKETNINKQQNKFEYLKKKLENLLKDSFVLPAFGVSLHNETLDALKQDEWLQINFSQTLNVNGLSFDALLFKLEETNGFNLIRFYNNKFDGRCIFLNLNKSWNLKNLLR